MTLAIKTPKLAIKTPFTCLPLNHRTSLFKFVCIFISSSKKKKKKMAKKRKDGVEIYDVIDRNEVMKLTEVAKSWEFTCSFCFKKFPSAQAMGGHQNAHRSQRLEEKRLFVRDPITYRKRAFLRAIKADESSGGSKHAAKMVKNETANFINVSNCNYQRSNRKDSSTGYINGDENVVMMNFLPPKELKSVGDNAEDHKGNKPCTRFNLDLTLKL